MSLFKLIRKAERSGRDVVVAALVIVSLMLSSFSPAFAAGGVTGSLQGTVVDTAGAPVPNAKITASSPTGTYKTVTDSKGSFSILGINADTYRISVETPGHDDAILSGVTVAGDQTDNVGQIKVGLSTIARVSAVNNGIFKRGQTQDITTITKIADTVGHEGNTDEQALVLAAPGASITDSGGITIRGGLKTETGYNFDGVPYNEPFFSGNGSNGRFSGVASAQIVEGAGDASQGNIAGGAVNLNIKRGTYPGTGLFDAEIGGPNSFQQGLLEYGIATRDGRVSNYFSYTQSNEHPYYGVRGTNVDTFDAYTGASRIVNQDLIDNFVFKFGHNLNQSLQVLYQNRDIRGYGFAGGVYGPGSANPTSQWQTDLRTLVPTGLASINAGGIAYSPYTGGTAADPGNSLALLEGLFPTFKGETGISGFPATDAQTSYNPTTLLKFEYDNTLDANDALQLRFYNVNLVNGVSAAYGANAGAEPDQAETGGRRSGVIFDFQRQIGTRETLSFNATGEIQHPQWNGVEPTTLFTAMEGLPSYAGTNGVGNSAGTDYGGTGSAPTIADFLQPVNGVCPVDGGCYLSNYFPNGTHLPNAGIDYRNTSFKTFGLGIRSQYQFGDNVKADIGFRYEGAIYDYGNNPFGVPAYDNGNPQDVPSSYLQNSFTNPRVPEPRAAISWDLNRDNSVRFGYGRSAIFLNAQTSGTPAGLYDYAGLQNVPALDSVDAPACGSGTNGLGFFKCKNYAEQLYWLWDQNNDAPDLGNATVETSSNYDFTYQHQFKGGYGFRVTPFYKLSTGVPAFAVKSITTDPATGQILSEVFTANNQGINKATGVETGFSTPDRLYGFTGFFSATYQNVLSSAPPLIGGEDSLPINFSGSIILNDVYRSGYVSPYSMRIGGDYKFKNGFRISPVLQYDIGYPYSIGTTTASKSPVLGHYANVIQTNNGGATSGATTSAEGAFGTSGAQLATQYVDPANPGNYLTPNIAATRGTPATSSTGGVLSPANLEADLTLEYRIGRSTFGIAANNLFGNEYNGTIPVINPYYQPVSTGVAGPQTGQLKQANPAYASGIYVDRGYANLSSATYAFANGAYVLSPSNPTNFRFYYQLGL